MQFGIGQGLATCRQRGLDGLLGDIDVRAARLLLLDGKLRHALHQFGHTTGLAQKLGLGVFQIGRGCSLRKQLLRAFDQRIQLVHIDS
ncbi:hypothetical protein D3C85_1754760 [compost metagenome]